MILFTKNNIITYDIDAMNAVICPTAIGPTAPLNIKSPKVFTTATSNASLKPNSKNVNITTKSLTSIFKNGAGGYGISI